MDFTSILSICCSLSCCVLFLAVIVGGVVFVLRRKGSSPEADVPVSSKPSAKRTATEKAAGDKPPPAPTIAPQPVEFSDDEAPTVVAPPPALPDLPAEPAPKKKPRAGQTIIAFDDEDDEEF